MSERSSTSTRNRPERLPDPLPLEPGDCLDREEFERRYEAMPHVKKAELVQGVVYMPSPVGHRRHGRPHHHLGGWLYNYELATPGVEGADNSSLRLELDQQPQPDLVLLIDPERGGQALISDDDYIVRAPELVAEIAASSASYDLHSKLEAYRDNGVQEYIVWRVLEEEIDWFVLREGQFQRNRPDDERILRSAAFPGLWLDASALIRGDLSAVQAVLEAGVSTPEHADFVSRLNP